jgi:beta-lactamase regulating signal transducer with metallopeptidase domain
MKMSLIVFGALAASWVLRRRSAALRHWVLAAGVGCAAASPLLSAIVPAWHLPFGTPAPLVSDETSSDTVRTESVAPRAASRANASRESPAPVRVSAVDSLAIAPILPVIWAAGVIVSLTILVVGVLRLTWLAVHSRHVIDGPWADLAREAAAAYNLKRAVTVLQSSHPSLVVTWGLISPKVILPATADEWSDERRRVVMSHELAHIRRGDWLVQLSAEVLRAVYWFNPLMWLACRRLRLESEHACDDEVMNQGVEGVDYATHLIDLARTLNKRHHSWFPAPAMARPSSLERRVRAMLNNQVDRHPISQGRRVAILALLLAATAAVAAAQSGFATVTGRIVDEQSRTIQGATVMLTNDARQAKYEVKTNADGRFEFVGLPAGDYSLEMRAMGFQVIRDAVTVAGKDVQRNYTAMLGRLQETVTIRVGANEPAPAGARDVPTLSGEVPMPPKRECVMQSTGGGRIVPPKKIRDARPYYPAALRGTGTAGVVELEARIGLDGYIADIRLVGDAQPDLAQSAIAAVREWRFTETLLNCTPVEVVMTVKVNFEVKG